MKLLLAITALLTFHHAPVGFVYAEEALADEGTCIADDSDADATSCKDINKEDLSKKEKIKYRDTCHYYLAESSIPKAGFGIYTVVDIKEGDPLQQVADAPSIIITDSEMHNDDEEEILWNHVDYFWDGSGQGEFEAHTVEESVVTFGSLCNFHTYLKNVKPDSHAYIDNLTPRSKGSPGMGAYSYQPGFIFATSRDIQAGEEIFCDYGAEWLDSRSFGKHITRQEEFETAGNIMKKTINGLGGDDGEDMSDSVLKTIKRIVYQFDKRASNILPDSKEKFKAYSADGKKAEEIALDLAKETVISRTLEWIKEHGTCIDNLLPQISTLPHAGKGAFAQRFIAKGELIAPCPLLQVMDYTYFNIYDFDLDDKGTPYLVKGADEEDANGHAEKEDEENMHVPIGSQLLMNYCMSHPETSMFMCPQTNVILMNHCSSRVSYGGDCYKYNNNPVSSLRGANAEMKWATDWDPDTEEWLKLSVDKMAQKVKRGKRGLSMDIIATRDIYPGEEVFLDYGEGWEEDWKEHVDTWLPPNPEDNYVPIKELNDDIENHLRRKSDLEKDPYPENADLACIYWPEDDEVINDLSDVEEDDRDWKSDGSKYHQENSHYKYYGIVIRCDVLEMNEAEDGEISYTVELYSKDGMSIWAANGKQRILTNYPVKSIEFVPIKYSSDQHIVGAFRSYIRIPDDIFPEHWKDMLVNSE